MKAHFTRGRMPGWRRWLLLFGLCLGAGWGAPAQAAETLKVAVIGGVKMSGVWDRLAPRLQAATGIPVQVVSAANKDGVVPDFAAGRADLLLIHGGRETYALEGAGLVGRQRVWGYNEHVVVGPVEDPAGVKGAADGSEAFRRIEKVRAPFVAARNQGSHEIVQHLWEAMGLRPAADWVVLDDAERPQQVLQLAAKRRAYVVVGALPVAFGKLQGDGMAVLVRGDPQMRRAYVAAEPGPRHPASPEARAGAARVADWLVSPAGQRALAEADQEAGGPWIHGLPWREGEGG